MSVTSSPQNSIRCGESPWAGNTSMIPPRTATSPGASTRSVRVYPIAASSSTTPSKSTSTPAASTTGVTRLGLTRWMAARTDATTTVLGSADASRWRASARTAIVPTLGEMCSNGSVPQAGSRRAPSWNRARSSTRSSASCSPGTTARIGRSSSPAIAASSNARSGGGTAARPGMAGRRSPGHSRASADSGAGGMRGSYRPGTPVGSGAKRPAPAQEPRSVECSLSSRTNSRRSACFWSGV